MDIKLTMILLDYQDSSGSNRNYSPFIAPKICVLWFKRRLDNEWTVTNKIYYNENFIWYLISYILNNYTYIFGIKYWSYTDYLDNNST